MSSSVHTETKIIGICAEFGGTPVVVDTVVTDSELPGLDPNNIGHDALVQEAIAEAIKGGWARWELTTASGDSFFY